MRAGRPDRIGAHAQSPTSPALPLLGVPRPRRRSCQIDTGGAAPVDRRSTPGGQRLFCFLRAVIAWCNYAVGLSAKRLSGDQAIRRSASRQVSERWKCNRKYAALADRYWLKFTGYNHRLCRISLTRRDTTIGSCTSIVSTNFWGVQTGVRFEFTLFHAPPP